MFIHIKMCWHRQTLKPTSLLSHIFMHLLESLCIRGMNFSCYNGTMYDWLLSTIHVNYVSILVKFREIQAWFEWDHVLMFYVDLMNEKFQNIWKQCSLVSFTTDNVKMLKKIDLDGWSCICTKWNNYQF